ncbi:MAG: 16S rRNA (adenine(1518)-N(6)/adenine(1519)-N(6))-dimethyltransferase RsmA [Gemmatimonadota bacterium]
MPKKSLGQHFLFDPRILARIAAALGSHADETILEIGPGRGTLTRELVKRGVRVVAIEKDRELLPVLVRDVPEVTIIEGDALELDWHVLTGGPFAVIGNIPYNITSPLIDKALTPPRPRVVVFLVQKEVAERVAAKPGGAEYGALSVGVQAVARVERLFNVSAGAFSPPPKVDSSVLRLTPLERPLVPDRDVAGFRRMVVGLFGFRRKQLLRGVRELTGLSIESARAIVARADLAETIRPQELSPADLVRLFTVLSG